MSQATQGDCGPLFTRRSILTIAVVFCGVIAAAWALRRLVGPLGKDVDVPLYWPMSIFYWKIPGLRAPFWRWFVAGGVLGLFLLALWNLRRITAGRCYVILTGLLLALATNLMHGAQHGLVRPLLGDGENTQKDRWQYYHDAQGIKSAGQFLREFEDRQPELGCHARTHPPGAVLFFYLLSKTIGYPAVVSVVITALAVGLSGAFFFGVLEREFDRQTCGYVTFLFLLIPAIQVYYCVTLDAIIAGCFLGVLFFFRHPNSLLGITAGAACLFCASFLTFGACFLVPIMVGFEIVTQRSVRRYAAMLLGVGLLYTVVYLLWGFNYLGSFGIASALENPEGFLLLTRPATYLLTRLENVAEVVLFLGPFLLVLFARGIRVMWRTSTCPELLLLTALGISTLLAMFVTGAFRTGETARACLFIYPYLILPVAACLHHHRCRYGDKRVLLWLVFGQTMAMQTLGGYFW